MNNYTNPVKTKRKGYSNLTYYGVDRNLDVPSGSTYTSKKFIVPNMSDYDSEEEYLKAQGNFEKELFNTDNEVLLNSIFEVDQDNDKIFFKPLGVKENVSTLGFITKTISTFSSELSVINPYIVSINGVTPGGKLSLKPENKLTVVLANVSLQPFTMETLDPGLVETDPIVTPKSTDTLLAKSGGDDSEYNHGTYYLTMYYIVNDNSFNAKGIKLLAADVPDTPSPDTPSNVTSITINMRVQSDGKTLISESTLAETLEPETFAYSDGFGFELPLSDSITLTAGFNNFLDNSNTGK